MSSDFEMIAKIVSPIITLLLGSILKYYTERRSKLVSFLVHISTFKLHDEPQTLVFTHSIVVRNTGGKSATNVRVGHNFLPPNIQVIPSVKYTIEQNPEGGAEIIFPIIVPKEQVTISYLYFPPLTWNQVNTYTKSDDGFANILNVIPMPQPPKSIIAIVWLLIFLGASFIMYCFVKGILFFIN